jgi:hypothetical protein
MKTHQILKIVCFRPDVMRNGIIYLDFDREAASLEEAVISAIKDVQSCDAKQNTMK